MKSIPVILLIILLQSCGQKVGVNPLGAFIEKQIVYDEGTWYLMWFEDENMDVTVVDTLCINQRKRALEDIENGKLTYFYYVGMAERYSSNEQMEALLSEYNIGIESTLTSCIAPPPGFENYCYENVMEKEIEARFGSHFIDSLRTIAERNYVLNNPDKLYSFQECDLIARYPGATTIHEHFENYKIDYFKHFEYPEDFQFKNEHNYSYTVAEFTLHKDSSVSEITVKTTFQNPKNEKYRKLFDSRMTQFIKNTKWIPAKSSGIVVNSKVPITIHYK